MSEKHDLIALVDLDGTLADFDKGLREELLPLVNPGEKLPFEDIDLQWRPSIWKGDEAFVYASRYISEGGSLHDLEKISPHWKHRMDLIKTVPGWWRNLRPIAPNFKVVDLFRRKGFDIHVLTKGPWTKPHAWMEKVEWCREHLGDTTGVHITDSPTGKGMVYGKVLMDDYPPYIDSWLKWRPRGLVVMPSQAWNRGAFEDDPRVIEWDGSTDRYNAIESRLQEIVEGSA